MKIVLVDDHVMFREGVSHALAAGPDMDVVGEGSDGEEALALVQRHEPDVILMDIHMPKMDGIEATRRIKQMKPSTRVVILTVSDNDKDLFEAIKAGADGYLLKNLGSGELALALKAAVAGESPVAPVIATRLLREFRQQPGPSGDRPGQQLTPREVEVLQLASHGLTYKEIAGKLHVSENTVKNHMRHIMEKLHLRNRSEAVGYAIRQGLVEK